MKKTVLATMLCLISALVLFLTGCATTAPTPADSSTSENATSDNGSVKEPLPENDDFVPVFRFIVCSDTHVSTATSIEAQRLKQMIESTYKYADTSDYKSVDALVIAGDITDTGSTAEFNVVRSIFDQNLRNETKLLTVMGNHDFKSGGIPVYAAAMGADADINASIKGYHFIGISPESGSLDGSYSTKFKWLSEQLAAANTEDPNKPIITFQHHHIKDTVYVSSEWYTSSGAILSNIYGEYSQVINFSGHSHGPINNPKSIWQKNFTALGTGTLSYFEMTKGMTYGSVPPDADNAAQFYIVEYNAENAVRIKPYDLISDSFFKTPSNTDGESEQLVYNISNLKDKSTWEYTEDRKNDATAPVWREGTVAEVTDIKTNQCTVKFSTAYDDSCLDSYRLTFTGSDNSTVVNNYFAEYYFQPMTEDYSFVVSGLHPGVDYTLKIVAVNVWGKETEGPTLTFKTKNEASIIYNSENPVKYTGTFTDFESYAALNRSQTNLQFGDVVDGDFFGGDWDGETSQPETVGAIVAGKGYNGSKALGVSTTRSEKNTSITLYANSANKLTTEYPTFNYLRLWVDFTDVELRKGAFGLVTPTGELYSSDDFDDRSDMSIYLLRDGTTEWQSIKLGDDGCFGNAQSSPVKGFKGWIAFPVKDFAYRTGTGTSAVNNGTAFSGNECVGIYLFFDYQDRTLYKGVQFFLDEIQLVPDYTVFTEYTAG